MFVTTLSFFSSHYLHHCTSGHQPNQALQVRFRTSTSTQISVPPSPELVDEILQGTTPTVVVFPLPLHKLERDPAAYVMQLLSTLDIPAAACEVIGGEIASYVKETVGGERERKLEIVAEVDCVEVSWTTAAVEDQKKNKEESESESELELGDCSICLDELNLNSENELNLNLNLNLNLEKTKEVIKIWCGHLYHHSCVHKWLLNNNSCPLCRSLLL